MKVAVFSTRNYDRQFLDRACGPNELVYFEAHLGPETAGLAAGFEAVCVFVNDRVTAEVIHQLAQSGLRLIALRSAGFNHVDLNAAKELGVTVVRVPAYSPHAVAEHTLALMLGLIRKIPRAHARVRDGNFSLEGLLGFDLYGKTAGLVGVGRIGSLVARLLHGFGCNLLAFDPYSEERFDFPIEMVDKKTLFQSADIISLHCPLTPDTHHIIDSEALACMRHGVMLINTSRGGLVDTKAVIAGLKTGRIGNLGLDVYEEEGDLFFDDLSDKFIADDIFARLLTFPNVLITGHQAFFTEEAMTAIAETTIENINAFAAGKKSGNEVKPEEVRG